MPDPVAFLKVFLIAAATAALISLLLGWPRRKTRSSRIGTGFTLGSAVGFYLGCWLLSAPSPRPAGETFAGALYRLVVEPVAHWPPTGDQDRLLLVLFPAVIAVELLSGVVARARWLFRLVRLVLALGAARLLLHQSVYLADLAGPGTKLWTFEQSCLFLGGMGAALAFVWGALALLIRRAPGRSVPLVLTLACGCAGLTIMLSGYASGGQLGLPLAAALAGVLLVSLFFPTQSDWSGPLGVGIVGLFALLVIGHFFGDLTTLHASLIFFSLLLCWVPELPPLRALRPSLRGLARIVLAAAPIFVALALAQQEFIRQSQQHAPNGEEAAPEDYENFYK